MFDLGTQELIVIFLVAFLVFGPKKLPELGRTLGRGMRELRKAMHGIKDSIEEASEDVTEKFNETKSDLEDAVYKGIESEFTFKDKEKKDLAEQDKGDSNNVKEESDNRDKSDNR